MIFMVMIFEVCLFTHGVMHKLGLIQELRIVSEFHLFRNNAKSKMLHEVNWLIWLEGNRKTKWNVKE